MMEHWQLWSVLGFSLVAALLPWAKAEDPESLPMIFQLPCILLALAAFIGVPWLLWREYTTSGLTHAALMFLSAWGGALVLHTMFLYVAIFIARKLAANNTTPIDKFLWFLRTCMQLASFVIAPLVAYRIRAGM